jgi:CMP-N-acetylneuraminic acid synthetase
MDELESVDINTEVDFLLAETLMAQRKEYAEKQETT